ncbi:esterase/lipase family protein [Lysobacter niastensis]|uniref:Alpha/beta hydrolase n=1 Tax=Lysobacter niastensis TaxID=380629 RepID=A0ABS0B7P2_9GAMM|nr:alpha/beta hydrolase [Lysobacter niastensis]MBF6023712.1 alpha/beta hydrolase [Lysobacter niastensis]
MSEPLSASVRILSTVPLLAAALTLAACGNAPPVKPDEAIAVHGPPSQLLAEAQAAASRGERGGHSADAARAWVECATLAYRLLDATPHAIGMQASELATHCTDRLLVQALRHRDRRWSPGPMELDGVPLSVEFRQLSPTLQPPLTLVRAQDVPMQMYGGQRFSRPGFGVPLAAITPRCEDAPSCQLYPPEGVFRWATAWIEADADGGTPHLVIGDPVAVDRLTHGAWQYPLAADTSAFYAYGAGTSKLERLAIWGLLGGDEVGRRAGLYLLEDYDPNKRPIIMIHGLGSSPLTWARLSNAIWGDPLLRSQFQVWHVVYQTNAPLLVIRRRVKGYIDDGWRLLDPEGDDPARNGVVLIGHSLGGVVSRLLCADSGEVLWDAGFTRPPQALDGDPEDIRRVAEVFHFTHYPGISRAIFMATPHRGSPTAEHFIGRFMRVLVGRRAPELEGLRRVAIANPEAVREELRPVFTRSRLNSISTLQPMQPVRRAGETLMPAAGIPFHTIAGVVPGSRPESDGVVPLASAIIPGAQSTLVIASEHNVQENPEAVAEVLRILREDIGHGR